MLVPSKRGNHDECKNISLGQTIGKYLSESMWQKKLCNYFGTIHI